jgi:hypothetical protein
LRNAALVNSERASYSFPLLVPCLGRWGTEASV